MNSKILILFVILGISTAIGSGRHSHIQKRFVFEAFQQAKSGLGDITKQITDVKEALKQKALDKVNAIAKPYVEKYENAKDQYEQTKEALTSNYNTIKSTVSQNVNDVGKIASEGVMDQVEKALINFSG